MDSMSAKLKSNESRLLPALKLMTLSAILGTAACYVSIAFGSPIGFFAALTLGCVGLLLACFFYYCSSRQFTSNDKDMDTTNSTKGSAEATQIVEPLK